MSDRTVLDGIETALRHATEHAATAEVTPAAILWPDESRQWEPVIRRVRERLPVLSLGTFHPAEWRGPAYWVRTVVDGGLPPPAEGVPIVYLPGYARSDIRAVEDAPAGLKPLTELQYRGVLFTQLSGRDWTIAAFLQASPARGGLGVDVAGDEASKSALLRAREKVVDCEIEALRAAAPLKAAFFDELLVPDLDRQVLRWLDDPLGFRAGLDEREWAAFRERFTERFGLRLEQGELAVAKALGMRATDAWQRVWRTYADAPGRYPKVEERLRSARPKKVSETLGVFDAGSWPQDNDDAEAELRTALRAVGELAAEDARARIRELETVHSARRTWVWAELGQAHLATALQWLATLASVTRENVPDGLDSLTRDYCSRGWQADDALMRALAVVEGEDAAVVGAAGRAVYRGWLEVGAERMTRAVTGEPGDYVSQPLVWDPGTCVIFTDGLRFDVGLRLAENLRSGGLSVDVRTHLAALPTITPTAKPAVSPAASRLKGGSKFGVIATTGATELSADGLRREIEAVGYQVLRSGETGDPTGRGWTEQGDIDSLGHEHEERLPRELDREVSRLGDRVRQLIAAGWERVVVVTDHGWLYLPGGLPKAELPLHLTERGAMRKGRAARLAEGSSTDVATAVWYWDPNVRIAFAPGIRTFSGSPVYEHGGLSPQECVVPVVVVSAGYRVAAGVGVAVHWEGMRARVSVTGTPDGSRVDLRGEAGRAESSIAGEGKELVEGRAALLVEDDSLEGQSAELVVIADDGRLLAQETVTVGG